MLSNKSDNPIGKLEGLFGLREGRCKRTAGVSEECRIRIQRLRGSQEAGKAGFDGLTLCLELDKIVCVQERDRSRSQECLHRLLSSLLCVVSAYLR